MIIRHAQPGDNAQIYEIFRGNAVPQHNFKSGIPERGMPAGGFYKYHLGYDDIAARVDSAFSLVLEDKGRISGYALAYDLNHALEIGQKGYHDPVHENLRMLNGKVVYLDQIYLDPKHPITLAARFADTLEYIARMEKIPGAVTAIPVSPWNNANSTRFALLRGFSRAGAVSTKECTLGLFIKPYLPLDTPFQNLGNHLMTRH